MMATSRGLSEFPFYSQRAGADRVPAAWGPAELEAYASAHRADPFAGRVWAGKIPKFALQLEATGSPSIWVGLDPPELDRWAGVVERMWKRWGTEPGETIAFFDYGSSPLVLLASSGYVGYLRRGAAERLGLTAICNDGVAAMADRMVRIVETLRPSMMILRRDLVIPFAMALEASSVNLAGCLRWAAVSEVEGGLSRGEADQFSRRLGVRVWRIFRADAAFLIAGECPACGKFHLDREYRARSLPSEHVAITTRFAKTCPAINYDIGAATLTGGGCALEPHAQCLEC
jgi:phenylacetate-coenzyme A ligase PaaK-like adenylate-forming protein